MRGFLIALLIFSNAAKAAEKPAAGDIIDVTDPTYGSRIRHLKKEDGHEHNLYYYRDPWNADQSCMVGVQSDLEQKNWRVVLYDGDGRFIRQLFTIDRFDWRIAWDHHDPRFLYTTRGSELYRFDVTAVKAELLKSLLPSGLKPAGISLNQAGDRILLITSDGTFHSFHLPDMSDERTFKPQIPAGCDVSWDKPRYIGHRNYIDFAYRSGDGTQQAIVIYDDVGKVHHTFDGIGGGGHYAFSSDGKLAYFQLPQNARQGAQKNLEIHVVNLDGSDDRTLLMIPREKATYMQNLHLAWPAKVNDWFIASFFPNAGRLPAQYAPPLDEILQIRMDGTHKYLARSHTAYSRAGEKGKTGDFFWAQPLAIPSADGSRICFNSNAAGTIDQYILYLP